MTVPIAQTRGGATLVTALIVGSLGNGLFLPLSLVYFTVLTDIPLPLLGIIVTSSVLITIPIPVIAGRLVDRFGAKRFVVAALSAQSVAYLLFTIVRDPWFVLAASMLMLIGSRFYWSSIFTAISDKARANGDAGGAPWFAVANIARTVGLAIGGLATGIAISIGNDATYVSIALVAAACMAIAATLLSRTLLFTVHDGTSNSGGYTDVLRDRRFLALIGLNSVFAMSTFFLALTLPTVMLSAISGPGWLTAVLLVANATLIAALGSRGARWAMARNPYRVLQFAAGAWIVAFVILALVVDSALAVAVSGVIAAVAFISLAEVLHAPTSMALANSMAADQTRGRYLAMFQYSFVAAEIVSPVLFAGLFTASHAVPFLVVAALNLAAIPLLGLLRRV